MKNFCSTLTTSSCNSIRRIYQHSISLEKEVYWEFIVLIMTFSEKAGPEGVGTKDNLPQNVRVMAALKSNVVAWTTFDPEFHAAIFPRACCRAFGPTLFWPCLWPFAILCSPQFCINSVAATKRIKNQFWILTEDELTVVVCDRDDNNRRNPGYSQRAQNSQNILTIPLKDITHCGVAPTEKSCMDLCTKQISCIYVNSAEGKHEVTGIALSGHDWFVQEVLNRRDVVVQGATTDVGINKATPAMDRGFPPPTTADLPRDVQKLRAEGVLTDEQVQTKVPKIFCSRIWRAPLALGLEPATDPHQNPHPCPRTHQNHHPHPHQNYHPHPHHHTHQNFHTHQNHHFPHQNPHPHTHTHVDGGGGFGGCGDGGGTGGFF